MRLLPLLLILALLSGCITTGGDAGELRITRDDMRRIISVEFHQPEDASEASSVSLTISTNGVITSEAYMGTQYNVTGVREAFKAMRIWHLTGIAMILGGIGLFFARRFVPGLALLSKKLSWGLVGGGVACAFIGHLVPSYGGIIAIVAGIIALAALLYVAWIRQKPVPSASA